MSDITQLPALICLYDDASEAVRREVLDTLVGFGDNLEASLNGLPSRPEQEVIASILDAVSQHVQARIPAPAPDKTTCETAVEGTPRISKPAEETDSRAPKAPHRRLVRYEEGQLVRHRRYGYRGVIVARDHTCHATNEWYESNRTRPAREQPWYHVLVDDAPHVTYAAQSSLLPDESMRAVQHPLVPFFFRKFKDGRYNRNERAWPALET